VEGEEEDGFSVEDDVSDGFFFSALTVPLRMMAFWF
jgi:hypothetical protein